LQFAIASSWSLQPATQPASYSPDDKPKSLETSTAVRQHDDTTLQKTASLPSGFLVAIRNLSIPTRKTTANEKKKKRKKKKEKKSQTQALKRKEGRKAQAGKQESKQAI
jgi:hypothetical protein